MKRHEEREAHIEKRWVLASITCDVCGAECPNPEDEDWSRGNGHTTRTWLRVGKYYGPEECIREVDICEACAEKLIDLIEAGQLHLKANAKGGSEASEREINEAMNAGIGIGRHGHDRRKLTVREAELLRAALQHEHPNVRNNAQAALDTAKREGRMPEEAKS